MLRLALLLAATTLAGCSASTRMVDTADVARLAQTDAEVRGRNAEIALASGDRYAGLMRDVRPDSTSWEMGSELLTIATPDVLYLLVDTRGRSLGRGLLIGAGVGFGTCFGLGLGLANEFETDGDDALGIGVVFGLLCAPAGLTYGLLGGALSNGQTMYVFEAPAEPAGPDAALDAAPDVDPEGDPGPAE